MRALCLLAVLALTACSSSEPKLDEGSSTEKQAAVQTDKCLDNPDLSKEWGECNVKNTVFLASAKLEKCRMDSPGARGTVDYEVKIMANGKVKSVKPMGGKHGKHTICVSRVLRKLQFAAPGKEATITVPYQLEP
jgi:hypothetical protein